MRLPWSQDDFRHRPHLASLRQHCRAFQPPAGVLDAGYAENHRADRWMKVLDVASPIETWAAAAQAACGPEMGRMALPVAHQMMAASVGVRSRRRCEWLGGSTCLWRPPTKRRRRSRGRCANRPLKQGDFSAQGTCHDRTVSHPSKRYAIASAFRRRRSSTVSTA